MSGYEMSGYEMSGYEMNFGDGALVGAVDEVAGYGFEAFGG
jgi:hypothetical protein